MKNKLITFKEGDVGFYCPGCEQYHVFFINKSRGHPSWNFNGDYENPTFTPSLLNTKPWKDDIYRCHLFVTNGKIQYLNDCSHKLAGQTIEMMIEDDTE